MTLRCQICRRGLPDWDVHACCPLHRQCTRPDPCAVCSTWSEPTWAQLEAWLTSHPPIQRAPALVPSAAARPSDLGLPARDPPVEGEPLPALAPEGRGSGPADPPLELLASGGSESEEEECRPWRHDRSSTTRSPPGPFQLTRGFESAGEPPRASSLLRAAPAPAARSTDRLVTPAARAALSHGPVRSPPPRPGRFARGV